MEFKKLSGKNHDLHEIYKRLNTQYFEGKLDIKIHWFGSHKRIPKYRIRLGVYNQRTRVIKIHRLLDQDHIPHYFVSSVVYHEMLHHVLPPIREKGNKRRSIHHTAFRDREKQFHDYALAKDYREVLKKDWFSTAMKSREHLLESVSEFDNGL